MARSLQTQRAMGALRTWLGDEGWTRFAQEQYGKQPFVLPGAARELIDTCSWQSLGAALASHAAGVQVIRRGESLSVTPPRSIAALRSLFEQNAGIALRNAEHASDHVRALAAAITEDVPGNQRVTMFATPAGTHSLAWHFDVDDLFVVQGAGVKTHHLRANTVLPRPLTQNGHSLAAYPLETSPLLVCELHPGDFLYVPAGFWHMALAKEDSLSVSIGVQAGPELQRLAAAPEMPRPVKRTALRDRLQHVRERLARFRDAADDTLARRPTLRRKRPV